MNILNFRKHTLKVFMKNGIIKSEAEISNISIQGGNFDKKKNTILFILLVAEKQMDTRCTTLVNITTSNYEPY